MTAGNISARPGKAPSGVTVIDSTRGWFWAELRALWTYRELLYFLVWRDVKVRYKQTLLGAGWAILQPVLAMLVFSVVFGIFVQVPSDGVPYPIFAYTALLPWNYFSGAIARAGNSLVGSASLITKVYFPRLAVPLSAALAGIVDFVIAFVILAGLMLFYGIRPASQVWLLPLIVIMLSAGALGVGLWLSALNVKYRDVGHVIPFLAQIWMYASPVVYPTSVVPEHLRLLYWLNPVAGIIDGFRAILLGTSTFDARAIVLSVVVSFLLLATGLVYFQRTEQTFADVV